MYMIRFTSDHYKRLGMYLCRNSIHIILLYGSIFPSVHSRRFMRNCIYQHLLIYSVIYYNMLVLRAHKDDSRTARLLYGHFHSAIDTRRHFSAGHNNYRAVRNAA